MLPLFVNLTMVITIVSMVAYTVFFSQRDAETVSLAQRNTARMEQVGASIRASLRPGSMNGSLLPPLGDPSGPPLSVAVKPDGRTAVNPSQQVCIDGMQDYLNGNPSAAFNQNCRRMGVPSWLVSDDKTPWGASYAYCPYSVDAYAGSPPGPPAPATTQGVVLDGDGTTSYRIRTVAVRGRNFVFQSDAGPIQSPDGVARTTQTEQVVGFLLSPPPYVRDKLPRCRDVAKVNGAWMVIPTANGAADGSYPGSVVPIVSRGLDAGQVANQGEVEIYAAASTVSGQPGTGNSPADPMAFKDALDLWHLTPWRSTQIHVKGGSYAFDATDTVPGNGALSRLALVTTYPGRSLRIDSSDGNRVAITGPSGGLDLAVGVAATLDSVDLGAGIQLRPLDGSSVAVTNSAMHHVRVDGGSLVLGTGTSVALDPGVNAISGIDVITGRLSLSGGQLPITGGAPVGIQVIGGDLVLNGTDIAYAVAGSGGTTVTPGVRVRVAPSAAGAWPRIVATGAASGTWQIGGEMQARASYAGNGQPATTADCDASNGNGTCVARCQTQAEASAGVRPLRTAIGGTCVASFTNASDPGQPSLVASGNGAQLGSDAGIWVCDWKAGSVLQQSPVAGGSVYTGPSPLPALTAAAQCVPNASLTFAPTSQTASAGSN